jgi:hypothetical protein
MEEEPEGLELALGGQARGLVTQLGRPEDEHGDVMLRGLRAAPRGFSRSGRRSTTPWQRCHLRGQAPGVAERPAQQHLDLGVDAAQLVVGPAADRVVHGRIDSEQYLPPFTHV